MVMSRFSGCIKNVLLYVNEFKGSFFQFRLFYMWSPLNARMEFIHWVLGLMWLVNIIMRLHYPK